MCDNEKCNCKKDKGLKCPNCGHDIKIIVGREAKGEEVNKDRKMNLSD